MRRLRRLAELFDTDIETVLHVATTLLLVSHRRGLPHNLAPTLHRALAPERPTNGIPSVATIIANSPAIRRLMGKG